VKKVALTLVTFAVLAVAAVPGLAQASTRTQAGGPFETAKQAARNLVTHDIPWSDGTVDTVDYAQCRGLGVHIGSRYRAFRCYVETEEDDPYWVLVRTGWASDSIQFLYYD
jgi:hypothetical protein